MLWIKNYEWIYIVYIIGIYIYVAKQVTLCKIVLVPIT